MADLLLGGLACWGRGVAGGDVLLGGDVASLADLLLLLAGSHGGLGFEPASRRLAGVSDREEAIRGGRVAYETIYAWRQIAGFEVSLHVRQASRGGRVGTVMREYGGYGDTGIWGYGDMGIWG